MTDAPTLDRRSIPAWQDIATLTHNLCICEEEVWARVQDGTLPPPRTIMGRQLWKWADVEAATVTKERGGFIYVARCREFIKIGIASSVEGRLKAMQSGCPYDIQLLNSWRGTATEEARLLARFKSLHHRGEWFRMEGDLVEWINKGCDK